MSSGQTTSNFAGEPSAKFGLLLLIILGLAIVAADAWDGQLYFGDPDDRMRALQVRELVHGGKFFDLTLSFIVLPESYSSHYSRLVDLPYFLIAMAGLPWLGTEAALEVAFLIWPPVMLVVFLWLAYSTARKINLGDMGIGQILVLVMLLGLAILEFSPGRIDHHNVQLLLMMIMAAGLVSGRRRGAWALGIAAACSIAVGLECIPYIVAGLGGLTIVATVRPNEHLDQLTSAGAGFALTAIPAGYLSLGPDGIFARSCDAIGAPWVSAIVAAGVILALVPLAWPLPLFREGRSALAFRFASLAVPAAMAGALLAYRFPECIGDPYGNVFGIARELWFDRIGQEKPLTAIVTGGSLPVAVLGGIYSFITVVGGWHAVRRFRAGDSAPILLIFIAVTSLIVFFMLFRSVRFTAAFVPMFLPAAFDLRNRAFPRGGAGEISAKRWLIAATLVPATMIGSVLAVGEAEENPPSVFDQMLVDDCKNQDISVLGRVEGGIVLASYAMSYRIAEEYPGHRISAVPLHRAAPAISRLLKAYTETDPEKRNSALAAYDYLAVCARNLGVADLDRTPLFEALVAGETIAGLEPVETPANTAFRLYRINRTALR